SQTDRQKKSHAMPLLADRTQTGTVLCKRLSISLGKAIFSPTTASTNNEKFADYLSQPIGQHAAIG
ncbi:MAG: hypothetical protein ACPG88_10010, partial [Porticoccaceae bacterium]